MGYAGEREPQALANVALRVVVAEGRRALAYDGDQEALAELFSFEHPETPWKDRLESAADVLNIQGGGDSFRKGRYRVLIRELADVLYRLALTWCIDQIDAGAIAGGHQWYRVIEFERRLEIGAADTTRQVWTTRFVLRAITAAQPIFLTAQQWTGTGPEPGELEILSGPAGGPHRHQLIHVRPEVGGLNGSRLYVFDLGSLVAAGQELELEYRQELRDALGTFRPMISFSTAHHPLLSKITLRARLPRVSPNAAYAHRVYRERAALTSAEAYVVAVRSVSTSGPIEVDEEGFFTYSDDAVKPGPQYELWWGPEAQTPYPVWG